MFFDKVYKSWRSIQEEKYEEIFRMIGERFLNVFREKLTLDIGSGEGYFEGFLEKKGITHKIVCLDSDKEVLEKCSSLRLIGDGNCLPFRDCSFDIVVSMDTMHLISKNDFRRALKDNGLAIFSTFFNAENYEERKNMLKEKLDGFEILLEFELRTQEQEYVIMARKISKTETNSNQTNYEKKAI